MRNESGKFTPIQAIEEPKNEVGELEKQKALWMAGLLEVGGSLYLSSHTKKVGQNLVTYTNPVVSYSDTNEEKMKLLVSEFKGFYTTTKSRSYQWKLKNIQQAVALVHSLREITPSRKTFTDAVLEWARCESREERVEVWEKMKGVNSMDKTSPEDYTGLIKDPAFLAGVIFARGAVYYGKGQNRAAEMRVSSPNKPLLIAMAQEYQGRTRTVPKIGKLIKIRERETIAQNDTHEADFGQSSIDRIFSHARLYLQYGRVNNPSLARS